MQTMARELGCPVGYSDHTLGIAVSIAAVALGAVVIEKHFTLDTGLPGPDHKASLQPAELAEMIAAIRSIERALGDGRKLPRPSETEMRDLVRKSLTARRDLVKSAVLTSDDVICLRPGTGIPRTRWRLPWDAAWRVICPPARPSPGPIWPSGRGRS